jgi:hypothetical protein
MAQRVDPEDVRALLNVKSTVDLQPFIDQATAVTDKVSSNDSSGVMNSALLKEVERNLAAHYYCLKDPGYHARTTEGASGTFYGKTDMGLDYTPFGQTAQEMDLTGFLSSLGKGRSIGITWLGLPPSEQTDYRDRD